MKRYNQEQIERLFSESVLCKSIIGAQSAIAWLRNRQAAHRYRIRQIPFCDLDHWHFDEETGNLVHDTGRFFTIRGVDVQTNWGTVGHWQQPIIDQPEIGYLGFLCKMIDGVLHFLVQAKMEPGNINLIQMAPTLQATRSNFSCVHKGTKPSFLQYFQAHDEHTVCWMFYNPNKGHGFSGSETGI
jgi:dTDP-4-dehydro-6-deoxy-alpha-D-glucopyranose 2,3-dehydratase